MVLEEKMGALVVEGVGFEGDSREIGARRGMEGEDEEILSRVRFLNRCCQ